MLKKVLIIILIVTSFFIVSINYNAYATFDEEIVIGESEEVIENENIEPKICEYNKSTNETTIIEINDIESIMNFEAVYSKAKLSETPSYRNNLFCTVRAGSQFYFANTGLPPYKYVCRIITSDFQYGTGYLVGPNLLLTCAHCVFSDRDPSKTFSGWTCYPRYDEGLDSSLLYSSGWDKIYYSTGYTESIFDSTSDKYDWCLCVLSEPLGTKMGDWLPCASYSEDSNLDSIPVQAIGYPRVYDENQNTFKFSGKVMHYSLGTISNTNPLYFDTNAKTYPGMSGGPVINTDNAYVIGIIKGNYKKDADTTYVVRLTTELVNLINSLT